MNTKIITSILMFHFTTQAMCQNNIPSVHGILFNEIASSYNTFNDKHDPMTYLYGFSIDGDTHSLLKNPVEVMFNPIAQVQREDCVLMRWDPVTRVWRKFSGNQLRSSREAGKSYWVSTINHSGVFALMKEIPACGSTEVHLPPGIYSQEWRYVQSNLSVVCEGYAQCQTLVIPLPSLSPVAKISVKYRNGGGSVDTITSLPLGALISDLWKKPEAFCEVWNLSLATVK
jgi:hypothetical protein